ncbi:hypothetical protein CNR22_17095 [Sphingobacteriaceae bacterium]|nr:hypothetical protein CNR22_17095 [Sphingobacteriaceae bacterium]
MKHIFTILFFSLVYSGFAQSPALINYQGVARDASGNPISGQISIKFEVLQGSNTGSAVFTENQTIQTTTLGIFSTQIGKSASLNGISWPGGPYFLRVSMDPAGGNNLVVLGTPQQIVSVPFAMHAASVPSTYTNNVLSIGSQTYTINSGTATTVSSTGTNISVSSGPNYTISYTSPQLSINSNNLSIDGGNTVTLPVALTPTLVPSGIATVTNGASSYTVGVPAPTFNMVNGVLTMGSATTLVTPTLGLSGGILYSGVFTNSVAIPSAVTVSGTGLATVTGGPANYLVNVAPPQLALSSNNLSISIVGSNSVALPAAVTVAQAANNIITVNSSPGAYTVGLANPVWTGTALILGASTTTIAPTLVYSGGTLTVGAAGNTVDISGAGPFKQAVGSVTLTNPGDNVALGQNSASAKLDVYSNASTGGIIKATNANATNTTAAVEASSSGAKSLYVTNTSAGGVAGDFSASGGNAVNAQNSSTFPAILAQNTNASGLAGQFIGGLSVEGGGSSSANFAFKAINNASSDLFNVRNDGYVGIGINAPTAALHIDAGANKPGFLLHNAVDVVGGALPFIIEANTASQTYGSNTYGRLMRLTNLTQTVSFDLGISGNGGFFLTTINNYASPSIYISSGSNVGIGTPAPVAKLDVAGNVKIFDGTQGDGKTFVSDGNGVGAWKSSPAAISFSGLNANSVTVTTSPTTLITSAMVFAKQYAATEVHISLHSLMGGGVFSGAGSIYFEIYVDGVAAGVTSRHYIKSTNKEEYVSLESYFSGLSVGNHTITIIAATDAGSSYPVTADPGGYNGRLLVKETF